MDHYHVKVLETDARWTTEHRDTAQGIARDLVREEGMHRDEIAVYPCSCTVPRSCTVEAIQKSDADGRVRAYSSREVRR